VRSEAGAVSPSFMRREDRGVVGLSEQAGGFGEAEREPHGVQYLRRDCVCGRARKSEEEGRGVW
jgi:hypothetical protein